MNKTSIITVLILLSFLTITRGDDLAYIISEAKKGDVEAQSVLGCMYYLGNEESGIKENPEEAIKWLRPAAQKGDREAQFIFGMCLRNGEGISANKEEGFKYIKLAAEQDSIPAIYELGRCYSNGWGCETNITEAIKCWNEAGDLGDSDSLFMLGLEFATGKRIERDQLKAQEYFQKAASLGHDGAKKAYELGTKLKTDLSERKNVVYIAFSGTSSSEIAEVTPTPVNSGYAIDLDSGELFSEGGHLITKFKNIDADILYGERIDQKGTKFIYQFNRISGTAYIKAYGKGQNRAIVNQSGTFTKKERKEKIF